MAGECLPSTARRERVCRGRARQGGGGRGTAFYVRAQLNSDLLFSRELPGRGGLRNQEGFADKVAWRKFLKEERIIWESPRYKVIRISQQHGKGTADVPGWSIQGER